MTELCWMLLEVPPPASLNSIFFVKASLTTNPFHFQYVVLLGKAISVLLALSGVGRQQKHFERRVVCPKGTTPFFALRTLHEIILSNIFSMNSFQPMSIPKPSNILTLAIQIQAGGYEAGHLLSSVLHCLGSSNKKSCWLFPYHAMVF